MSLECGINFHAPWTDNPANVRAPMLATFKDTGLAWVRIDVGLTNCIPNSPGVWDASYLSRIDTIIAEAEAAGRRILLMLHIMPRWARISPDVQASQPSDPTVYSAAIGALAKRWAGRVHWEVLNEPDSKDFWAPVAGATAAQTAAAYVALAKLAYAAVKVNDPRATVVLAAPQYLGLASGWVDNCYKAGAKHGVTHDVLAIHPYMSPSNTSPDLTVSGTTDITNWSIRGIAKVIALMDKYGDTSDIWCTEFGWSTHTNPAGTAVWNLGVTEAQQAAFTALAITELAKFDRVKAAMLYCDRDYPRLSNPQQINCGILRADLTAKPVVASVKTALAALPTADAAAQLAAAQKAIANLNTSLEAAYAINATLTADNVTKAKRIQQLEAVILAARGDLAAVPVP